MDFILDRGETVIAACFLVRPDNITGSTPEVRFHRERQSCCPALEAAVPPGKCPVIRVPAAGSAEAVGEGH